MNVDSLIGEVFKRKPLWDQRDPRHHNRFVLDRKWDEVAAEMKSTRGAVRIKWKSLRDNFRKELQKKPLSGDGGSESTRKSSWKHFESLRFLQDQFTPRSAEGSLPEVSTDSVAASFDVTDSIEHTDFIPDDSSQASQGSHQATSSNQAVTSGTRKRQRPDEIDRAMIRLEERKLDILENNQRQCQKVMIDDDEAFFNSLLPYVRPLEHAEKLLLRIKMQQLVYDFVKSSAPPRQSWQSPPHHALTAQIQGNRASSAPSSMVSYYSGQSENDDDDRIDQ